MKRATRVKFIYRMTAFCWLLWAGSGLAALTGSVDAAGLNVVAALLVILIGTYVLGEGAAGVEAVTSGSAPMSRPVARFLFGAAPVNLALGAVALLAWLAGFKESPQALRFIHIAPNAVLAAAALSAVLRDRLKKDRPLLDAPRFMAGLALVGVDAVCFAIMVATRNRIEAARGLRSAASWAALFATLGDLAVMFRIKAFRLARHRRAVMDDGDHPPLWLRVLLIYTAQGCAVATLFNALLMLATGMMAKDFVQSVQMSCLIGMPISAVISGCIVLVNGLRGNVLPGPGAQAPSAPRPSVPAVPKPPATVSATARRQQLHARAKALEKEEDAVLKGTVPVSADVPPSMERPAALTPAELSQRRALEEELVAVLSAYRQKREKALREYRARHNALKAQAQADAARLKAAAALREKEDGEAAVRAFVEDRRAEAQRQNRAQRAESLAREAAGAPEGAVAPSAQSIEALLARAAARMKPRGAELRTVQGQRALLKDLAALLPGFDADRADALVRSAGQRDGPALPQAVGQALGMACDALARTGPEEATRAWRGLEPEALARGWRALGLYGGISTARAMFEAVGSRLAAHMAARPDCIQWLEAQGGEEEA